MTLHRDRHKLEVDETAAVGDSLSDAQMAANVGRCFIVSGGEDALRDAKPDNVTILDELGGDGFARAVEALL